MTGDSVRKRANHMPKLVEFTNSGTYNTVYINPLLVMIVATDEDQKPFIAFTDTIGRPEALRHR